MPLGTRLHRAAATPVAPQLTHVTVGDFCRAQAVRDALSAAGGAVPCQDKDRQRVGTARGQGVRDEGQRMALTKGAVAVAVVGAMVQEGVRDAVGVTCRTRRVPVTLGGTPVPGLHGPWTQSSSQHPALAWGKFRAKDRAGTYPGAMLGVPGKSREERDRPSQMQRPSTALPAPQQRSLGPPCPLPLTLGFVPRDSGGQWGTPAGSEALAQAQEGRISRNSPGRALRAPACCLQPSPVSRLGEPMAARSPFLLCCLQRETAVSPFVPLLGRGDTARGPPPGLCPWAQHPEGQ